MATVDKRHDKHGNFISYRIRVSRGRDESGKQLKPFVMSWKPPEGWGKRSIEAELKNVVAQFISDCKDGKIETKEMRSERLSQERIDAEIQLEDERKRKTLRRYAEDVYMPRKSSEFSQNTIENYTACFTRIFKYLGDIKIENITKADIVDFITSLQTKETITRKFRNGKEVVTKQSLAFNNILKHYQVLSAVFSEAYQIDDLIAVNPMDKVPRPAPRKNDAIKEMHTFTVKEIRHILECLENEPLQWQVIIRLMIDTGARRGEIAGLRWKSVDFNNKTIKIENNLQYSPKIGVYETTPKGKKNRTIDIDPEIMALMQSLRDTQKVKTLKDYCFTQPDTGSPIFPQSPTKYLKTFGKKYGIKNLHPHALRHSAATIAVTHGANIAGVAAKLGHSDTSTTLDRYTHADQNAIKMGNETYRKALRKKAK